MPMIMPASEPQTPGLPPPYFFTPMTGAMLS